MREEAKRPLAHVHHNKDDSLGLRERGTGHEILEIPRDIHHHGGARLVQHARREDVQAEAVLLSLYTLKS